VAAGYLPPEHGPYLDGLKRQMQEWGLGGHFEYRGEVDRSEKIAFLHTLDVLSVPATYHEPKGIFLMEAMAAGVPVVQPRHGAFPEILDKTGGGLLVEPDDPDALADGLLAIWNDPARAEALSRAGARGVREHYNVERMAEAVEKIYQDLQR
jgi:glycosyltransferase involved in cell wall biosynthesis